MQNMIIRKENSSDCRKVEELTRKAFWNVYRPGCLEHYLVHRARKQAGFLPELSLVLEKDGALIGYVMYAKAQIDTETGPLPILTFGPLSILPGERGKGDGGLLLRRSMQLAAQTGAAALAITGDMGFYGRFGFLPGKQLGIRYAPDPDADYFLVAPLKAGALDGIRGSYTDPEIYLVDEAEAEAFDGDFPPMVKEKRPGQLF